MNTFQTIIKSTFYQGLLVMTELKALLFVHLFVQAFFVKFDLVPAWNFHPSGWKETDNLERF